MTGRFLPLSVLCLISASSLPPVAYSQFAGSGFPDITGVLSDAGITQVPDVKVGDTMNFGACLKFEMDVGVDTCKNLFEGAGVKVEFKYYEPTALVEVSCLRGQSMLNDSMGWAIPTLSSLSSGLRMSQDQKCQAPVASKHGPGPNTLYSDALVWGVAPMSRYESSGSEKEVTQSLICYAASNFSLLTDMMNAFNNFGSFMDGLGNINPSAYIQDIGNSIAASAQSALDSLANLPADIAASLEQGLTDLANIVPDTVNSIDQAFTDIANLDVSIGSLADAAGNFALSQAQQFVPGPLQQAAGLPNLSNYLDNIANYYDGAADTWSTQVVQTSRLQSGGQFADYQNAAAAFKPVLVAQLNNIRDVTREVSGAPVTTGNSQREKMMEGAQALRFMAVNFRNMARAFESATFVDRNGEFDLGLALGTVKLLDPDNMRIVAENLNAGAAVVTALAEHAPQDVKVAAIGGGGYSSVQDQFNRLARGMSKLSTEIASLDYAEDYNKLYKAMNKIAATRGVENPPPDIVQMVTDRRGRYRPEIVQNGSSQLLARKVESQMESSTALLDMARNAAVGAVEYANNKLLENEVGDACYTFQQLQEVDTKISRLHAQVEGANHDGTVLPHATYRPYGHTQTAKANEPPEACPLTSAGYVTQPTIGEGLKKKYINCEEVCTTTQSSNGGPPQTTCEMLPRTDKYAPDGDISCEKNRISDYTIDGKYPACNGYYYKTETRRVRAPDGEWMTKEFVTDQVGYQSNWDHHKMLETEKVSKMRGRISRVQRDVQQARQQLGQRLQKAGADCQKYSNYRPAEMGPSAADLAMTPVIDPQQARIQQQAGLGFVPPDHPQPDRRLAQSGGFVQSLTGTSSSAAGGAYNPLTSANFSLPGSNYASTFLTTLSNPTLLGNMAMGQVMGVMPYGFWPAFYSGDHASLWSGGSQDLGSMVNNLAQLYPGMGMTVYSACSALSKTGGIAGGSVSGMLSNMGCIGSWGFDRPLGFSDHPEVPKHAALIMARGYNFAAKNFMISHDDYTGAKFNMDYPPLYTQSPYTSKVMQASGQKSYGQGKHKGSRCYSVGTEANAWHEVGENSSITTQGYAKGLEIANRAIRENPDIETKMAEGNYVFTLWKGSKCEMVVGPGDVAKLLAGGVPDMCKFEWEEFSEPLPEDDWWTNRTIF